MRLVVFLYLSLFCISHAYATDKLPEKVALALKYSLSGSGNLYPYYTNEPEKPGILAEIIIEVLEQAKIQGINLEQPAKRTVQYIESGLIDFDTISPSWLSESEKHDPRFVFSEPLIEMKEYIVTGPDFHSSKPLLENQLVGTVRGYYYHDDEYFERVDFTSERELLLALKMKRVDRIIIGELPALYWSEKLNVNIELKALHSSGFIHIRLLAKHAELLKQINAAIVALRESGRFNQIEQHYVTSLPSLLQGLQ